MRKRIITLLLVFAFGFARADEGMWLLYLLGDKVYNDMMKRGLKLTKEQLYSINQPSVKDAIIIFGGGCTGEIVSPEGLIFTNHHCGYGAIAAASSVEKNYLRDGFWAKTKSEEISTNLSVQFLVRIEDVTKQVEESIAGLNGTERAAKLRSVSEEIGKKAVTVPSQEGRVFPFFKGNQFLLFVYERYSDIRLVGTPPESVGKFGGDTDNWEWPRHTGDFSVFRVYSGKDGRPAPYAAENIPFKAKRYLNVSTKGVADGDFSMILGYPGGTNRYETSLGVKLKTEIENPTLVGLRDVRLKFMFEEMKKDPAVKLKLASSYAGIANYWKFFDGEGKQLLKYGVYEQKKASEEKFIQWAAGNSEYQSVFPDYDKAYKEWWPYAKQRMHMNEGILGSPLAMYAASFQAMERALTKKVPDTEEIHKIAESLNRTRKIFMENENRVSDEKILAATCEMFHKDIDSSQQPGEFYARLREQFGDLSDKNTYSKYATDIFSRTIIFDDARWNTFLMKPDSATLQNDPAYRYVSAFLKNYAKYSSKSIAFNNQINDLGRIYLKGVMAMSPDPRRYPDANFTMRLSYGSVKSYRPRDAVFYDYICTMSGVLDKYKPGDYEFDLPKELLETARKKDFGPYKDTRTNDLVVNFITTNDITGGNSGSPVLNGKGELVGLAFDGNYEALSHKIAFDKDLNRTICVDIRYVLWCIDKLGGAKNIISELTLK